MARAIERRPRSGTRAAARTCATLLAAAATAACVGPFRVLRPLPAAPPMDPARIARDVAWLADDAREGRGAGTEGLGAAADYIRREFRAAGFEPGGPDGSYFQPFEMPISIRVSKARLHLWGRALSEGQDFGALLSSRDGLARSTVVFAGYGITAPEHGYDDYADVDVEGRIALVLDDRPGDEDGRLGGSAGAAFLRSAYKVANAHRHGAAAVLLAPSAEDLPGLPAKNDRTLANPTTQPGGVISLAVSRAAAERIVAAGGGPSLAERQRAIDASSQPASQVLTAEVEIEVSIEREYGEAVNVIALREGSDPELRGQAVVVGAHYDHLGLGGYGSLSPDRRGEIHNGADDNASGAAGLLELARAFASEPPGRRTLVLAAFAGEETGLLGSGEYADSPAVPIGDTVAMLNLDMIGRLRNGELTVFGTGSSPTFPGLMERALRGAPLTLIRGEGGFAPSDQTTFYAREVPVLFFFTGVHSEYHTPDDDFEKINAEGEARVLETIYRVAKALLDTPVRPKVVTAAPPARERGRGYGPYLGVVPDFAASPEPGVVLQGVRANSPAEGAGLRPGDRIVEFDGAPIANLEEFAALLSSARPGQLVGIVAIRDGSPVHTETRLGQRR
jgi:hypothetical protein